MTGAAVKGGNANPFASANASATAPELPAVGVSLTLINQATTSMPNDWFAPLFYILLGALLLFGLQQFARLVQRSMSRSPGSELPLGPRSDLNSRAVDHVHSGAIHERYWLWDNLTAREMEIARLVAQGKRNAQVARDLQISPYTVETHLKHIYTKLQVSSRTELAHVVRELVD